MTMSKYLGLSVVVIVVLGIVDLHAWWFDISRELSGVQFLIGFAIYQATNDD